MQKRTKAWTSQSPNQQELLLMKGPKANRVREAENDEQTTVRENGNLLKSSLRNHSRRSSRIFGRTISCLRQGRERMFWTSQTKTSPKFSSPALTERKLIRLHLTFLGIVLGRPQKNCKKGWSQHFRTWTSMKWHLTQATATLRQKTLSFLWTLEQPGSKRSRRLWYRLSRFTSRLQMKTCRTFWRKRSGNWMEKMNTFQWSRKKLSLPTTIKCSWLILVLWLKTYLAVSSCHVRSSPGWTILWSPPDARQDRQAPKRRKHKKIK